MACLNDRYPVLSGTDDVNLEDNQSHRDALQEEMTSNLPRRDIFLPLMKKTFTVRRQYILHEASSVRAIIDDYPALKEPSAVGLTSIYLHCNSLSV